REYHRMRQVKILLQRPAGVKGERTRRCLIPFGTGSLLAQGPAPGQRRGSSGSVFFGPVPPRVTFCPSRSSCEVGKGAYAPSPLTDPDVLNSSIRFLGHGFTS